MGPIWGVTMNEINQRLLWDFICGHYNECKKLASMWDPICEYYIECKKPMTITKPICRCCIFENGLMEIIIENDVGIICLKCVYCSKSL